MRRLAGCLAGLLLVTARVVVAAPDAASDPAARPAIAPEAAPLDRSVPVTLDAVQPVDRLSERYYGNSAAARAILLANGLPAWGRRLPALPAGKPLRLPTSWSYRIRSGDTWAQLAADYLGDPARGPFLARLNGKPVEEVAPSGHVIVVPTVIDAVIPRNLRVEKMAALLLDLPERDHRVKALVDWIRDYNGSPRVSPARRTLLHIPLPGLRLLGWFVPTSLPRQDPGVRRRAERALDEARTDLRKGRYVEALERLGPVARTTGLPKEVIAQLHLARCTALTALGRSELATEAARAALAARPGWVLDPVQVSPKVRVVFEQAGRASSSTPLPRLRGGN